MSSRKDKRLMMTSTTVNNHENSIVWIPDRFHLSWGFQKNAMGKFGYSKQGHS